MEIGIQVRIIGRQVHRAPLHGAVQRPFCQVESARAVTRVCMGPRNLYIYELLVVLELGYL